jgi:PIN domain nuclease of toxin-antitoxin system
VVEFPAAVADTNALVFHGTRSGRLGTRARRLLEAAEQQQALVYVPLAVVWETALTDRAGRINLRRSVPEFFEDLFSKPSFLPYDLTLDQIYTAADLRFNRDPFDALIVAAAQSLDLPLLTSDGPIRESGAVRVIW